MLDEKIAKQIAKILKNRREELEVSINQISEALFLRSKYLTAIEEADLSDLPQGVYIVSYIRKYAEHLGVDEQVEAILAKANKSIDIKHFDKSDVYIRPNYSKFAIALLLFSFILLSIWHFCSKQNNIGRIIRSYNSQENYTKGNNVDILVPIEEIESWVDGLSNGEQVDHFSE